MTKKPYLIACFQEKWPPVFRPETRQNNNLGSGFDFIKTGKTLALTAGLLSIAVIGTAQAAGPGPRGEGRFMEFRFDELDQNKDGFITREEAEARQSERFEKVDANNDGKLSLAEIRQSRAQRHEEMRQKRFSALDADNSGTVSSEEFSKGSAEHMSRRSEGRFSRMDENDDGVLTLDEMGRRHRR